MRIIKQIPQKEKPKKVYAVYKDKLIAPAFADIAPYLQSKDFKRNLIGKYWLIANEYLKLELALEALEDGKLEDKKPKTPVHLLEFERDLYGWLLDVLMARAKHEEIDLLAIFKAKQKG